MARKTLADIYDEECDAAIDDIEAETRRKRRKATSASKKVIVKAAKQKKPRRLSTLAVELGGKAYGVYLKDKKRLGDDIANDLKKVM